MILEGRKIRLRYKLTAEVMMSNTSLSTLNIKTLKALQKVH